jgi:PAS domain S-box-containing protein
MRGAAAEDKFRAPQRAPPRATTVCGTCQASRGRRPSVTVPQPRVLIALADGPNADDVARALDLSGQPVTVERCADETALNAAVARGPVALVLSEPSFGGGALDVFARVEAETHAALRGVLLFDRADDPLRLSAANTGVIDYVKTGERPDKALAALAARVLTRDVLEARLDSTTFQYRVLVENSTDGIYVLKWPQFVWANPRFQEMVGFPLEELMKEGFSLDEIIAPASRAMLKERQRRVQQGQPVEPRYEFIAQRRDGSNFDAQVSISYITFDGEPAALGIMQDITERKRFESQLVRKNRELALLNELSVSINAAVEIDPLLKVGVTRVHDLLRAAATGISLLSSDGRWLELRASSGLDAATVDAFSHIPLAGRSLLADAVSRGEVFVVDDLKTDPRVGIAHVRTTAFHAATVVPVMAESRALGALFVFVGEKHDVTPADRELMQTIGVLIGTALEKARLFEKERSLVERLAAVDEIALAASSELRAADIADTVTRSVQTLFGPDYVMLARYDEVDDTLLPLGVRDGTRSLSDLPALASSSTILGRALFDRVSCEVVSERDEITLAFDLSLVDKGLHCLLAVPVSSDAKLSGGLLLGWTTPVPRDESVLKALQAVGTHVAVALKNASLFAAREKALEDLKAAQEKLLQSERLRALGELAAGVAHDFNNVLGAILGRAQLIKHHTDDRALLRHAEIIEKAASDGAETVRRIQEIGRQETTDDFLVVDLGEVVRDVAEMTQPKWRDLTAREDRQVVLHTHVSDGAALVLGNASELREVLINLVHNAVDALPSGGHIKLSAEIVDAKWCRVTVRDDGVGIPEHVRARVFEPFFTTKGDRGTGLGLAVSFSIVGRHGGEISVKSTTEGPEHGTSFEILLPRMRAPIEHEGGHAPVSSSGERGVARILVIDDEENIREILTDILSTGGYEVLTAETGLEGLALLDAHPCDLVFTDLGLPGMNGYEVALEVRKRHPNLPVGLVTGWGATLDREAARAHGIDLIVSKPFKFDHVLALVSSALAVR